MNPAHLVENLTAVTARLGELMAAENEILRNRRPAELKQHEAEKHRLTGAYAAQMAELRRTPDLLEQVDPRTVAALKAATRRFQDVLAEHRRMLQAARTVAERVMRAISDEAAKRHAPARSYDGGAHVAPAFNAARQAVPLTLNQTI